MQFYRHNQFFFNNLAAFLKAQAKYVRIYKR